MYPVGARLDDPAFEPFRMVESVGDPAGPEKSGRYVVAGREAQHVIGEHADVWEEVGVEVGPEVVTVEPLVNVARYPSSAAMTAAT